MSISHCEGLIKYNIVTVNINLIQYIVVVILANLRKDINSTKSLNNLFFLDFKKFFSYISDNLVRNIMFKLSGYPVSSEN